MSFAPRTSLHFQPEGLAELSPGWSKAIPWVRVPQNHLHPERVQEFRQVTVLAPFQGADFLHCSPRVACALRKQPWAVYLPPFRWL
jgi:hypothetical protein